MAHCSHRNIYHCALPLPPLLLFVHCFYIILNRQVCMERVFMETTACAFATIMQSVAARYTYMGCTGASQSSCRITTHRRGYPRHLGQGSCSHRLRSRGSRRWPASRTSRYRRYWRVMCSASSQMTGKDPAGHETRKPGEGQRRRKARVGSISVPSV